ncbi:MAG: hypothetical protein KDI71_24325 [Xanthomonadales bacterium]|nr:hypothetical protein [Xanthomonadales bacterium]
MDRTAVGVSHFKLCERIIAMGTLGGLVNDQPEGPKMNSYPGDVYFYHGDISREGYAELSSLLEDRDDKAQKACLILITDGGNPHAAYRMARALFHHYREFEVLIADTCKSAGTLLCTGAKKLIFGDRGELGPLDIQVSKPDEMFENMSGLALIQALNALQGQTLVAFRQYLMDIRRRSQIGTRLAAEIAVKLADGFISPIASKIDPITVGEHQRAMSIAMAYGQRLSKMSSSLRPGALVRLLSDYPSHGFVIDRKEASELFNNVEAPCPQTLPLYAAARNIVDSSNYPDPPMVIDLLKEINLNREKRDEQHDTATDNPGSDGASTDPDDSPEPIGGGDDQDSSGSAASDSRAITEPSVADDAKSRVTRGKKERRAS